MPGFLRILGVLVPGMLLFVFGLGLAVLQADKLGRYEQKPATILGSGVSPHPLGGYAPLVSYAVQVSERGNRNVKASGVTPLGLGSNRMWAQQLANSWPKGTQVVAYVNPEDASDAYLVRHVVTLPIMAAALGWFLMCLPIAFVMRGGAMRPHAQVLGEDAHGWHALVADRLEQRFAVWLGVMSILCGLGGISLAVYHVISTGSPWLSGGALGPALLGVLGVIGLGVSLAHAAKARSQADFDVCLTRPEATLHRQLVVKVVPQEASDGSGPVDGRDLPVKEVRAALVLDRWTLFGRQRRFSLTQPVAWTRMEAEPVRFELPQNRRPKAKLVTRLSSTGGDSSSPSGGCLIGLETWALELVLTGLDGHKIVTRYPIVVADPGTKTMTLSDLSA